MSFKIDIKKYINPETGAITDNRLAIALGHKDDNSRTLLLEAQCAEMETVYRLYVKGHVAVRDRATGDLLEGERIHAEVLQLLDTGELNPWSNHPRYSVESSAYITWEDDQGEEHPASMYSIFIDPQVQIDLLELYLLREEIIKPRKTRASLRPLNGPTRLKLVHDAEQEAQKAGEEDGKNTEG